MRLQILEICTKYLQYIASFGLQLCSFTEVMVKIHQPSFSYFAGKVNDITAIPTVKIHRSEDTKFMFRVSLSGLFTPYNMPVHRKQSGPLSFSEGGGDGACKSLEQAEGRGREWGGVQGRRRKGDEEERKKRKSKNDKNLLKATIHSSLYKMKHYYSCLDKTSNKVAAVVE